jgi:hypothetical protein
MRGKHGEKDDDANSQKDQEKYLFLFPEHPEEKKAKKRESILFELIKTAVFGIKALLSSHRLILVVCGDGSGDKSVL